MPVLNLTTGDLAGLFLRLLPRGRVWPKALSALQPQAIAALMPTYARLVARDNNLLVETFPATSVETLPEWESTLGLPDPCAGPDATIAQRQAHVVARLTQQNGPSIPSLVQFAAVVGGGTVDDLVGADGVSLTSPLDGQGLVAIAGGYQITITEFAPARHGRHKYGQPTYGKAWAHAWQVNVAGTTVTPATYGKHRYGEPYRTWGNAVLECEMNRIKPAHTVLIFAYAGPVAAGGWDTELGGWAA